MKLYFSCTLLSDTVLTGQAATEGFHPSLDYIPGSKFLGIVAADMYDTDEDAKQKTLDLFHNGEVKFGNAYPYCDEEVFYPMPYAWFRDKLKNETKIFLTSQAEGLQLKQQRKGFVSKDGKKICKIKQKFSIKSAYSRDLRKSEDKNMYGYFALPKGGKYVFSVEVGSDKTDTAALIKALQGDKHIGRSRTAEYGLVHIEKITDIGEQVQNPIIEKERLTVYAAADLCFTDAYGFSTTEIKAEYFGLNKDAVPDFSASQIKTRIYQSYNGTRRTKNADYSVIMRGSVIVFKGVTSVGAVSKTGRLQSEGFGDVLYNPEFLRSTSKRLPLPEEVFNVTHNIRRIEMQTGDNDRLIRAMLQRRLNLKEGDRATEIAADEYVGKYYEKLYKNSGISKSQWGAVKGIAKSTLDVEDLTDLLFKKQTGFLCNGVAGKNWNGKSEHLEKFLENNRKVDTRDLLIKISSKMQKAIKKNENAKQNEK